MAASKLSLNTSRVTKNELYMNYTSAVSLKRKMSKELTKISQTLNKLNKVLTKAISDETVKGKATWIKTVKAAATNCSKQAKLAESKRQKLDGKFDKDSEIFVGEVLGGKYQQVDQSINEISGGTDDDAIVDSDTSGTSTPDGYTNSSDTTSYNDTSDSGIGEPASDYTASVDDNPPIEIAGDTIVTDGGVDNITTDVENKAIEIDPDTGNIDVVEY